VVPAGVVHLRRAIARIAAVHIARDEKISVRQANPDSRPTSCSASCSRRWIPVLILLVIASSSPPPAGSVPHPDRRADRRAVLFFLALIAGLVMTLVLLGLVAGST